MPIRDISIQQALGAASRYDLVLAVIPAAFLIGLMLSQIMDMPVRLGLGLASVFGGAALVDALFLNPPNRGGIGETGAAD